MVVVLSQLLQACSEQSQLPSSVSAPIDWGQEVLLAETDTEFIGEVSGFAVLDDSVFLVSDRRNGVLHVFDGQGRRLRVVGRRGEGPQEWGMGPTVVTPLASGLVAIGDGPRTAILSTADWTIFQRVAKPAASATLIGEIGVALVFGDISQDHRASLASVSRVDSTIARFGHVPEIAAGNIMVATYFSHPAFAPLQSDSFAIAWQSSDFLFFGSSYSERFDSVFVPPVVRRGSLSADLRKVSANRTDLAQALMYKPSYPLGIIRAAGGDVFGLLTADLTQQDGRMTGRLHLSVVSRSNGIACNEMALDVPDDPLPFVFARGAKLFVISQESIEGRSVTRVRSGTLKQSSCPS